MRTPRTFLVIAIAVCTLPLVIACATARLSPPPDLVRTLQSLIQAPKSVATFDAVFIGGLAGGAIHSHYQSRGDSTVTADVFIRELLPYESGDTAFVRKKAEVFVMDIRRDKDVPVDTLTIRVREPVTYQTPKGPAPSYRVRMTRVRKGISEGVHVYAMAVGRRLIGVRAEHPSDRDVSSEIDRFVEALALAMSESGAESLPVTGLVPSNQIGGFTLVNTHRYPTPDAGIQYRYRDSTGLEADVYVYRGDAPRHGADVNAALRAEVGNFRETLPLGVTRGYYGAYSIVSDTLLTVRVAERDHALHRISMGMTRAGEAQDSYFYLAVVGGEYVKVRITQPTGKFPLARADGFVTAVLEDLTRKA
jgi:hypothetical protein